MYLHKWEGRCTTTRLSLWLSKEESTGRYGEKLHFDIFRDLTRSTVYDISFKARCSIGLTVTKYLGGFGEVAENTVQLSVLDADQTIAFTLKQDVKLKLDSVAYIQFAILFTTGAGERKIRVFNYTLNITESASTPSQCI